MSVAPVSGSNAHTNGVVATRIDVIAEAQASLAVTSGEGQCAFAAIFTNQIDACAVVLAAMTQTVVNIRFAAVTLEAGRTDAPEAPEAIDDLASTFILAGVTETRVNLVLTRVAMKTW